MHIEQLFIFCFRWWITKTEICFFKSSDDPEMIFCLEEDQESSGPVAASAAKPLRPGSPVRSEKKKPKHVSIRHC